MDYKDLVNFLSAMVMPNIRAFIAWGFITALFIADGWIPNAKLASIQPYMLTFFTNADRLHRW